MMGKEHYVKIAPEYFEAIDQGVKGFEIRFNDRNYKVGDILYLREYCDERYTGRELKREICYIVDDPRFCKEGFVVLGITAKTTTNTCEECVHKKICYEIEGLRCRADFIWYKAEYGCPHYNNEADYRKQSEGEWKQKEFWEGGGTWRCSECGRQIMFLRGTPKTENMYFCPGCGAKMKGGAE